MALIQSCQLWNKKWILCWHNLLRVDLLLDLCRSQTPATWRRSLLSALWCPGTQGVAHRCPHTHTFTELLQPACSWHTQGQCLCSCKTTRLLQNFGGKKRLTSYVEYIVLQMDELLFFFPLLICSVKNITGTRFYIYTYVCVCVYIYNFIYVFIYLYLLTFLYIIELYIIQRAMTPPLV